MSTRRKFLLNCSAVAVAASVVPTKVFAFRLKEVSLGQVSQSTFAGHVNAVFQVQSDSGVTTALRLVAVQPAPVYASAAAAPDAANEKFSLLFHGIARRPLAQGSYWFEHRDLGRFSLFIVPVGPADTHHRLYQAIFNRPTGGPLPQAGDGAIPVGNARNRRRATEAAG